MSLPALTVASEHESWIVSPSRRQTFTYVSRTIEESPRSFFSCLSPRWSFWESSSSSFPGTPGPPPPPLLPHYEENRGCLLGLGGSDDHLLLNHTHACMHGCNNHKHIVQYSLTFGFKCYMHVIFVHIPLTNLLYSKQDPNHEGTTAEEFNMTYKSRSPKTLWMYESQINSWAKKVP